MQKSIILLFFLLCGICYSQHSGSEDCALQHENKAWVAKYKSLEDREDKIDLVVRKMIADAYYFQDNSESADLNDTKVLAQNSCSPNCSIRFGLIYGNKRGVKLDLSRHPELEDLVANFTAENIDSIDLNEYQENNIYRTFALNRYGVVLYTANKDLQKQIKRVLRKINKS